MSAKLSNNEAWDNIFAQLPIEKTVLEHGYFDITADEIKRYGKREPRLMAKIDFREQLPKIMSKKKYSLLAIENGVYRIGKFDPFIDIEPEYQGNLQTKPFPKNILTITPEGLAHESAMLDAAKISGILEDVFAEKVELTVRGRTRSPDFDFNLSGIPFTISGVQVEVDGGYEGERSIHLVEAKIGGRNNISLRQLLYPQFSWEKKVSSQKTVKSYICFYQAPIIRFIPILFQNGICRADCASEQGFLLEQYAEQFEIESVPESSEDLIWQKDLPFPQADRFETVLAMFTIISASDKGEVEKETLSDEFLLVERQINYYSSALCWLGILQKGKRGFSLTPKGTEIAKESHPEKIEAFAKIIFKNPVFHYALHVTTVLNTEMERRFKTCGVGSNSTQDRRLQTVKAWIKYFKKQTQPDADG